MWGAFVRYVEVGARGDLGYSLGLFSSPSLIGPAGELGRAPGGRGLGLPKATHGACEGQLAVGLPHPLLAGENMAVCMDGLWVLPVTSHLGLGSWGLRVTCPGQ